MASLLAPAAAASAPPLPLTQSRINRACEAICDKFGTVPDTQLDAMSLQDFLQHMQSVTADITMQYINEHDRLLQVNKPAEVHTQGLCSTRILTALKQIRSNYTNANLAADKIKITGTIRPADSMCLFVCGLLTYPGNMSFNNWVENHAEYAHAFFDYTIQNLNKTITVQETGPVTDAAATAAFDAMDKSPTLVPGSCFICALENDTRNASSDNILILDAFSDKDQFLKYEPAVWHLYCLWRFNFATDKRMRCFAARTPTVSYIFIAHYAEHARTVTAEITTTQAHAVRELVVRPLELYTRSLAQLTNIGKPAAFISRIWPDTIDHYFPLVYVHLLMPRECPLFADTTYTTAIESMIEFVVGRTHEDIIKLLPYTPPTPQQPNPLNPGDPAPDALATLAQAHHRLMMASAFVVPLDATQKQIMFGEIDAAGNSEHLDYIGALCQVRYNWVFLWRPGAAGPSILDGIKTPTPDAPYHEIDVYRHVAHLQTSLRTRTHFTNTFLKTLSTGRYVTESGIPNPRAGVIVFDVQEHGHFHGYFVSQRAVYEALKKQGLKDTYSVFAGLDATCAKFGIDTKKTQDRCVVDAMLAFFKRPSNAPFSAHWSLSDMAFKYVVFDASTNSFFMQDSLALIEQDTKIKPPSCADLRFCPVCFTPKLTALTAEHPTMYDHIQTHTGFHILAAPDVALLNPTLGAGHQSPRMPVVVPTLALVEEAASESGNSAGSHNGDTHDPAADDTAAKFQEAIQKLKGQFNLRDYENASVTQFEVAKHTKEQCQQQYDKLKKKHEDLLERIRQDSLSMTALLDKDLRDLYQKLAEDEKNAMKQNTDLQEAQDKLSNLHQQQMRDNMEQIRQQTEANKKEREEANKKHELELKASIEKIAADARRHEEELRKLQETHDEKVRIHDDKVREHDNLVAALRQEIEALQKQRQEEAAKNKDVDALHLQITQLQADIERLTRDLADLRAAEKTAQDALQAEIIRLRAALVDAVAAHADPAALATAQAEVRALRREIARLHKQMQAMTASVEQTLKQNRAGLAELKQTIGAHVQRQIADTDLLQKMTQATPDYAAVRKAVQATSARPSKLYSPAALFLILESMGATWCMWLQNTAHKNRTKELDRLRDIIFRQILYDLTMWDSIANTDKKTRYVSAYTAEFIRTFKLRGVADADPHADNSTDDEAAADAALDIPTLDRERVRAEAAAALQRAADDAAV